MKKENSEENRNDVVKELQSKFEVEFFSLVEKNEDISCYLYFPYEFLSEKVRDYLDVFLIEEAYSRLEAGKLSKENFEVYRDSIMVIKLDDEEKQIETLERLLEHYMEKEEYIKCALIKKLLNNYDNHEQNKSAGDSPADGIRDES